MLSPVLADSLLLESSHEIHLMEISDAGMLRAYFTQKVSQELLKKNYVLVVIPEKMELSVPSKILSRSNLAHYTCAFQQNDVVDPLLAERIRILADLKEIPLLRQEYNHLQLRYKELQNKIREALLLINKAGVKNPSFKEMLLSFKKKPEVSIPESVVESIASININPGVINQIKKLQSHYQPRFIFMDECSRMNISALEDHESLQFAKQEIQNLFTGLDKNIFDIEHELFLMKKIISFEVDEELAAWTKTKEELQEAFLEYEIENYPTSFEEQGIPIIKKLKGYKYLKLGLDISPEKGWGQVSQLLNVISAIMKSAPESIDFYFEEYIRKLSPFHTSNENLDAYIAESLQLLKTINATKYIDLSCKNQFLQIDALLGTLKDMHQQLLLCNKALQDDEFIQFKIALNELNIDENVLKCLYSNDQVAWDQIVEYFGHRSHLTSTYDSSMTRIIDWSEELKNVHLSLKHLENKEVHNRWCGQRNQSNTNIRNSNWEMYRDLFEEGKQFSFQFLLDKLSEDLQTFFPILIVRDTDIKYAVSHPNLNFETAIFLDHKEVSITDVSVMHEKNIQLTIASTYNIDTQDLTSDYNIVRNFCSDVLIDKPIRFQDLDQTDRYRYTVALGGLLSNQIRAANIYKIENKVIISTVDKNLDQRLQDVLNISPNNYLYIATKEIAHFVETFIHHNDIILITENGFLNDIQGQSSLWQHSVIQTLQRSGINVLDLPTFKLYHNFNSTMTDLINELNLTTSEPIESDTPLLV